LIPHEAELMTNAREQRTEIVAGRDSLASAKPVRNRQSGIDYYLIGGVTL
jgi:hypothetical protein